MSKQWMVLGAIALGVLIIGGWLMSSYNSIVAANKGVDGAWSQVQVQLQRRMDMTPQLIGAVSGAANFEKSTLENITKARSGMQEALQSGSRDQQVEAARQFDQAMYQFRIQVEAYPQLGATKNFATLQEQLEGSENRISVERKRYNDSAVAYNTMIAQFPKNVVAGLFGFKEAKLYSAAAGAEQAPEVKFNF